MYADLSLSPDPILLLSVLAAVLCCTSSLLLRLPGMMLRNLPALVMVCTLTPSPSVISPSETEVLERLGGATIMSEERSLCSTGAGLEGLGGR